MNTDKKEWYCVKTGSKIFLYKNGQLMWTMTGTGRLEE